MFALELSNIHVMLPRPTKYSTNFCDGFSTNTDIPDLRPEYSTSTSTPRIWFGQQHVSTGGQIGFKIAWFEINSPFIREAARPAPMSHYRQHRTSHYLESYEPPGVRRRAFIVRKLLDYIRSLTAL